MRKFKLKEKGTNNEIDLNGSIFLNSPSGWGFQNENVYEESEDFFLAVSRKSAPVQKYGQVVFVADPYTNYRRMIDFIHSAGTLTLMYRPKNEWFNVDVDVITVGKGELNRYGALECPFTFAPLTPIYNIQEVVERISGGSLDGAKTYNLSGGDYYYTYDYTYSSTDAQGEAEFEINSQLPSAFEMILNGAVSSPVVTVSVDGKTIGRVDLSGISAEAGEFISYSSVPRYSKVVLSDGVTETDLTDYLGLSSDYPSFFRLPPNKRVKFAIGADSLTDIDVTIRFHRYYRSV